MEENNLIIDSNTIGESLKNIRLTHNMSQDEFAKTLNVSPKLVSKWENGERIPRIETFKLINKKYGITFEEITTGTFKPELTSKEAIEHLLDYRIIKVLTIVCLYIVMLLYAIITNNTQYYSVDIETNNLNINDANLIIDDHTFDFSFDKIDVADSIKNNISLNFYIKGNNSSLLFSCDIVYNTCNETYKKNIIETKYLKENLDNIYVEVISNNKTTKSKLVILKHTNNQSMQNLITIPNELLKKEIKVERFNKCLMINREKLVSNLNKSGSLITLKKYKYIIRTNKNSYIIFDLNHHIMIPKYDSSFYLRSNGRVEKIIPIRNNKICLPKDKYYIFLKNIIDYFD